MNISRYSVTLQTKGHGQIIYHTVSTSPHNARNSVLSAELCPPSCVKRTRKLKTLHPR